MNKDRETIVVDCNSQYGRCNVVNKLQDKISRIESLCYRHKILYASNAGIQQLTSMILEII